MVQSPAVLAEFLACQSTLSLETYPTPVPSVGFHIVKVPVDLLGVGAESLKRELCGGGPTPFPSHVPK